MPTDEVEHQCDEGGSRQFSRDQQHLHFRDERPEEISEGGEWRLGTLTLTPPSLLDAQGIRLIN